MKVIKIAFRLTGKILNQDVFSKITFNLWKYIPSLLKVKRINRKFMNITRTDFKFYESYYITDAMDVAVGSMYATIFEELLSRSL